MGFDDMNLDPRVAEYMRKKQEAEQGVDTANTITGVAQFGDMIANAGRKPVVMENRMQDLGKAPAMIEQEQQKTNTSGLQDQAREKLKSASHEAGDAVKVAFEQRKAQLAAQVAEKQAEREKVYKDREYEQNERKIAQAGELAKLKLGQDGQIARMTAGAKQDEKDAKREADKEALKIEGYGYANNADDAKQLKDATIGKSNFDNKLQQLIDLRTEKKGGAILDREAVARGKQLSKDLLLEYKNLQKLGVLSQSDEAIINAIIPSDPLEYNSPVAAIQGQDPILNNMKKFKGDSDTDFQTRLKMRLKGGETQTQAAGKPATVTQDGHTYTLNPQTGEYE